MQSYKGTFISASVMVVAAALLGHGAAFVIGKIPFISSPNPWLLTFIIFLGLLYYAFVLYREYAAPLLTDDELAELGRLKRDMPGLFQDRVQTAYQAAGAGSGAFGPAAPRGPISQSTPY
jgi:membrane protein implicated in regulation of membrane protease activity